MSSQRSGGGSEIGYKAAASTSHRKRGGTQKRGTKILENYYIFSIMIAQLSIILQKSLYF